MKLSDDVKSIYKNLRISIREISMSNPLDNRPHHGFPLTFRIKYYVMGQPPKGGKNTDLSRAVILQECEDTVNVALMGLEEHVVEELLGHMYEIKKVIETKVAESLGVESCQK
jgi:hypothetical protein